MLKIELVHKKTALNLLQNFCQADGSFGFTTLEVQAGCGPLQGLYSPDFTDAQYYSFILMEGEKALDFIKDLKQALAHEKCLVFTSPVTRLAL
jgi:hypothetical protein